MADPHAPYVGRASERYRRAYAGVARAVRKTFPKATAVVEHGMPAWLVPRPKDAPRPEREGTMPSDHVFLGLVERKSGITVHLWYPGDYSLFDKHKRELQKAGLKVMRGCLVFNRKEGFPVDAIGDLLAEIRRLDAGGATRAARRTGAGPSRRKAARRAR